MRAILFMESESLPDGLPEHFTVCDAFKVLSDFVKKNRKGLQELVQQMEAISTPETQVIAKVDMAGADADAPGAMQDLKTVLGAHSANQAMEAILDLLLRIQIAEGGRDSYGNEPPRHIDSMNERLSELTDIMTDPRLSVLLDAYLDRIDEELDANQNPEEMEIPIPPLPEDLMHRAQILLCLPTPQLAFENLADLRGEIRFS